MLTGTISTFFIDKRSETTSYKVEVVKEIQVKLDNFDDLSKEDLIKMHNVLMSLKD